MILPIAGCNAGGIIGAAIDNDVAKPTEVVRDTVRVSAERFVRDSLDIPRAAAWRVTRTFLTPGRVEFLCSIHPTMNGVVWVR